MPAQICEVFREAHVIGRPTAPGAKHAAEVLAACHHRIIVFYQIIYDERPDSEIIGLMETGYVEVRRKKLLCVQDGRKKHERYETCSGSNNRSSSIHL
jgi:hypothetical protein